MSPTSKEDEERMICIGHSRNILTTLLYLGSEEAKNPLPTIRKYVHRDICLGVNEHMTGKESPYKTIHEIENSFPGWRGSVEVEGWKQIKDSLQNDGKLQQKNREALVYLLQANPTQDGSAFYSGLSYFWDFGLENGICLNFNRSTSMLMNGLEIVRDVVPRFSLEELKDIQGIGQAMVKYIARDVEEIKKTYHW